MTYLRILVKKLFSEINYISCYNFEKFLILQNHVAQLLNENVNNETLILVNNLRVAGSPMELKFLQGSSGFTDVCETINPTQMS